MYLSWIFFGFLFCQVLSQINAAVSNENKKPVLNIAVIGAGVSGLCSARHAIAQGFNVTIFEQTEQIGGTWFYTDQVGKDQYGVKIHTSMYQGLRQHTLINYSCISYNNKRMPYSTSERMRPTK